MWVPDEGSEALRDLVRAREAAKQDQLRARHRLAKFLLRVGRRPAAGMKAWTAPYMTWVRQVRFAQVAREATMLDYLHEVDHMGERVKRLEQAITEAVKLATPAVREVVKGLQALRGIAEISAVTIVAELGSITRFDTPRQLMGYSRAPTDRFFVRGVGAARFPARTPAENERNVAASPRQATRICGASRLKRRGVIGCGQALGLRCASDKKECRKRSRRSPGRRRSGSRNAMPGCRQGPTQDRHRRGARTAGLHLGHRDQGGSGQ